MSNYIKYVFNELTLGDCWGIVAGKPIEDSFRVYDAESAQSKVQLGRFKEFIKAVNDQDAYFGTIFSDGVQLEMIVPPSVKIVRVKWDSKVKIDGDVVSARDCVNGQWVSFRFNKKVEI